MLVKKLLIGIIMDNQKAESHPQSIQTIINMRSDDNHHHCQALGQSVTFVIFWYERISEYICIKDFDRNEYPNIFVSKILIRTNIRIFSYQNFDPNEYPNIFVSKNSSERIFEYIRVKTKYSNECTNIFVFPETTLMNVDWPYQWICWQSFGMLALLHCDYIVVWLYVGDSFGSHHLDKLLVTVLDWILLANAVVTVINWSSWWLHSAALASNPHSRHKTIVWLSSLFLEVGSEQICNYRYIYGKGLMLWSD